MYADQEFLEFLVSGELAFDHYQETPFLSACEIIGARNRRFAQDPQMSDLTSRLVLLRKGVMSTLIR